MNRAPFRSLALAMSLALALSLPAGAQPLADPTRPPPQARLTGAEDAPAATQGPQLQSILIGTRGREVAVIDGQTLRRGDKIHGATLVAISKNQVVLQHGRERQVLTLFPHADAEPKAPAHQR